MLAACSASWLPTGEQLAAWFGGGLSDPVGYLRANTTNDPSTGDFCPYRHAAVKCSNKAVHLNRRL
ncbi:MAG: hypothetical protein ACLP3C_08350, partial [Mycobacterium sp.]|uniref:hypothetical protein n=1 Tax=Mycobacterium sp. TaxID=1785 RepID=UPI003F99B6FE